MKKNRLYTLNKWNQPVFMQDRLFPEGGTLAGFDRAASAEYGAKYGDEGFTLNDYMNSKNAFGISKADNPFSKGNLAGGLGAMVKTPIGGALIGGLASTVGKIGGGLIGGGLESGVGNAIGNIGGTIGSAISSVNPIVGGIVSVGSGIIGGGINRLFGEKVDTERLNQANADISSLSNFRSNAGSFDDIQGPAAVANVGGIYKGGIWNSSAERKQKALEEKMLAARQFADRSVINNSGNLVSDQLSDSLYNYAALGGPIEIGDSTGAIGYDFMDRYLTAKERQAKKDKQTGINQIPAFMSNSFAIGGDLQTNGADYSVGKIYNVSEEEANRLKAMGYEFRVIG